MATNVVATDGEVLEEFTEELLSDYWRLKSAGKGDQCKVWLARHKVTGVEIGIKIREAKDRFSSNAKPGRVNGEIFMQAKLDHPNLMSWVNAEGL